MRGCKSTPSLPARTVEPKRPLSKAGGGAEDGLVGRGITLTTVLQATGEDTVAMASETTKGADQMRGKNDEEGEDANGAEGGDQKEHPGCGANEDDAANNPTGDAGDAAAKDNPTADRIALNSGEGADPDASR
jgi:hypothetical protein